MIDWPKVVQDLEKENARLKKDVEQFQMALAEQVKLNKNLFANSGKMVEYRIAEPAYCQDEGCDHHGTKHVCVTPKEEKNT